MTCPKADRNCNNFEWTRIAKIESNETLTLRVAGLTSATEYRFRVTSYIVTENSSLYSAYAYINGTTL
ncbi:MAG: hypothetical protein IJZ51_07675 [Ruminiclostridium sp.]|nr:hypothetical protein [Ruminiclostridium sp.]